MRTIITLNPWAFAEFNKGDQTVDIYCLWSSSEAEKRFYEIHPEYPTGVTYWKVSKYRRYTYGGRSYYLGRTNALVKRFSKYKYRFIFLMDDIWCTSDYLN